MTTLNLQSSPAKTEESSTGLVPDSTAVNINVKEETNATKGRMHFHEWWSEYQEKMKSRLQGGSLKLQLQGQL